MAKTLTNWFKLSIFQSNLRVKCEITKLCQGIVISSGFYTLGFQGLTVLNNSTTRKYGSNKAFIGLSIDLQPVLKPMVLYMIPEFLENLYGQKFVKFDVYVLISSPIGAAT